METDLSLALDLWRKALIGYDFNQLTQKPGVNQWSLGQVYTHLISETNFFIEQANICACTNDHAAEHTTASTRELFENDKLPDQRLKTPTNTSGQPQPVSKQKLEQALEILADKIIATKLLLASSLCKGKTPHPGLGYLNAKEWYKFARMHLLHHLLQKSRIDAALNLTAFQK